MHDVVIIGAGPAGATLALLCRQAGLDTVLVDARLTDHEPRPDTRNFAIVRGSWNLLKTAGVAARIDTASRQPLNGLEATDGAARFPGAPSLLFSNDDIAPEGGEETLGYMIEAQALQAALDTAIEATPRLATRRPALFQDYCQVPGGVRVTLDDGTALQSRLLVGCDGVNSPVRRAAGIGVEGRSYRKSVFAANVALTRPHDGIARQLFTPEGPFATLPLTGERANLAWYMKSGAAEALARRPVEEIEAELNHRFAEFAGEMRIVGPVSAYPLQLQVARDMIAERVALVGDAAHRINPLAGQGLNIGFKDGAALSQLAGQALRCGLDPGAGSVLDAYRRTRRFDNILTALGMDAIDRLYSNDNPLAKPLRGLALATADKIPVIRRALARQASATGRDNVRQTMDIAGREALGHE